MDTRDKLIEIRRSLEATFVERKAAIECILLGALAQQHVLFLGPPGTGKSALVTALTSCIAGCDTFVTLLTKFTTEDELCGPAKLSALKQDRFERATAGHLPTAHVAFLDEVFKANAACLNATLSITNERHYKGQPCPLRFLAAASNEAPEDESLGAMYDRFLLRAVVSYVADEASWVAMLAAEPRFKAPCSLSLAEWDQAHQAAMALPVPRGVLEELSKVRTTLASRGVVASDRRWIWGLAAIRAAAYLDGAAEVDVDHLQALRFTLWQTQDQIQVVTAVLATLPQGPARQAITIIDEALSAVAAGRPVEPDAYFRALPSLVQKCEEAARSVRRFNNKLGKAGAQRVSAALEELKKTHASLRKDLDERLRATPSAL